MTIQGHKTSRVFPDSWWENYQRRIFLLNSYLMKDFLMLIKDLFIISETGVLPDLSGKHSWCWQERWGGHVECLLGLPKAQDAPGQANQSWTHKSEAPPTQTKNRQTLSSLRNSFINQTKHTEHRVNDECSWLCSASCFCFLLFLFKHFLNSYTCVLAADVAQTDHLHCHTTTVRQPPPPRSTVWATLLHLAACVWGRFHRQQPFVNLTFRRFARADLFLLFSHQPLCLCQNFPWCDRCCCPLESTHSAACVSSSGSPPSLWKESNYR